MSKNVWVGVALAVVVVAIIGIIWATREPEPGVVRIGAILPLSGDAAPYGKSMQMGFNQAIWEINESGGVSNRKLRIIYEDSQADPKTGVSAFQKLTDVNKVHAVLGPMASSVTLAIAPIAERKRVIILTPSSSAPAITNAGDYIFRNCTSDVFDGMVVARYAVQHHKLRRFAVLCVNNDFGVGLDDSFSKEVESLGGSVELRERFEQGATDFRTQLLKIKTKTVQGLFFVAYREAPKILVQAKQLGVQIPMFSVGIFEDPKVIELARASAEGVSYSYRSYDPESEATRVRDFVAAYRGRFGKTPDLFAVYSYDAANLLAEALRNSDLTDEGIKNALYRIRAFPAVTGNITFDKYGDVMLPMGIKTVKNGQFTWVNRDFFKPEK